MESEDKEPDDYAHYEQDFYVPRFVIFLSLAAVTGAAAFHSIILAVHGYNFIIVPLFENIVSWIQTAEGVHSFGSKEFMPPFADHLESIFGKYGLSFDGILGVKAILNWFPFLVVLAGFAWFWIYMRLSLKSLKSSL